MSKPIITSSNDKLPYDELSPHDFERLCLRLVERAGYLKPELLGRAGDRGVDIAAYTSSDAGEELWYFSCKRVRNITASTYKNEIDKINSLATIQPNRRAAGIVFITSATLSNSVRKEVEQYCRQLRYACVFWDRNELEKRVRLHADIIDEFFVTSEVQATKTEPSQPETSSGRRIETAARMSIDIVDGRVSGAGSPTPTVSTAETENLPADVLRPRNETIFTASVSDQPAKTDALGFEPYVKAIADFLDNDRTAPPLTLSIEGEWGSGKSSFMTQLEGLLRERNNLTVKFNAWRHDKEDELWAAFALEFIEQISDEQPFLRRWRANISLRRRRYDWAGGWLDLSRVAATWLLILCAVIGVPLLLYYKGLDWITWLTKSISDGSIGGEIVGWIVSLGGFFAGLVGVITLWMKLKDYIGNPIAVDLKKHLKSPNYEERIAFIENFHKDLKHVVSSYVGRKKVYIFIDDLDRCEVPKAADLMQAINLMIANDPQLIFIIGMDREKIAAGLAVKHEKLLPYLSSQRNAQEPLAGSPPAPVSSTKPAFDPANGLEYGYRFIEKFIQLPFRVPQPGKQDLRRLLDSLDVTTNTGRQVQPKWWPRIRSITFFSGKPKNLSSPTERPQLSSVATGTEVAVVAQPVLTAEQAVRRRQMLNLVNGETETETVRNIVMMVAPILDANPRRIKQFINQFRLKAHIANETGLFDIVDEHPDEALTLEQLGKFVALTQRYPRLLADLETDNELLNKLQYRAQGLDLPEHYRTSAAVTQWEQEAPLIELLRHGVADGSPIVPSAYSLASLKIERLLQVSPRVPRQTPTETENTVPKTKAGDSTQSDEQGGEQSTGIDSNYLQIIDDHLKYGAVRSALDVGRAHLNSGRAELSYKIFQYILGKTDRNHPDYYIILGNIGYSLNRMGRYEEAVEYFDRVKSYNNGDTFFAWHSVAQAYAYFKLGNLNMYKELLYYTMNRPEYAQEVVGFKDIYPEIANDLTHVSGESKDQVGQPTIVASEPPQDSLNVYTILLSPTEATETDEGVYATIRNDYAKDNNGKSIFNKDFGFWMWGVRLKGPLPEEHRSGFTTAKEAEEAARQEYQRLRTGSAK